MFLGWDWWEFYEVLNVMRRNDVGEVSLAGDPTKDLDLEQLVSNRAFREASEGE